MIAVRHPSCARRSAVLLELMLAMALFVGAAVFALGSARSVLISIEHNHKRLEAVDLLRSRLAELEAGIISLADLRAGESVPSTVDLATSWAYELRTQRTAYTSLTLVELTIRERHNTQRQTAETGGLEFTLRQLIPLQPGDDPDDYESEDIPTEAASPSPFSREAVQ